MYYLYPTNHLLPPIGGDGWFMGIVGVGFGELIGIDGVGLVWFMGIVGEGWIIQIAASLPSV